MSSSMDRLEKTRTLSAVLCADWGKDLSKRCVYVADVAARRIRRLSAPGWTVGRVLDAADEWTRAGAVLATFDAPLGVPESYLAAFGRFAPSSHPANFLQLLDRV